VITLKWVYKLKRDEVSVIIKHKTRLVARGFLQREGIDFNDALVITGTKDAEVAAFKEEMKATFQMSDLGSLSFYLGIKVHQDDFGVTLRQTAYAKCVVELAGLTNCNPALTPMEERLKLSHDSTTEEVDAT
jgi:hypothetical protein